jgi:SAM-dependent methyltransferase
MKWIAKAFLQKFLSMLPNGECINYLLQKHITSSLPIGESEFLRMIDNAFKHFRRFTLYSGKEQVDDLKLFEFGAGWELVAPLTYAAMGVGNQTIIDLVPHVRFELVTVTLAYFKKNRDIIEQKYGYKLSETFFKQVSVTPTDMSLLLQSVGINYRAPMDARSTGLGGDSYDLITNTSTLEHIPPADILKILRECYRILKPGGIFSCIIDLQDHFSYFDHSISIYNFLKFSDKVWSYFFNSSLHYQNRLRANDYLELFKQAGFNVLEVEKYKPESHELDALRSLKLNKRFRGRDLIEDVSIKHLDVLAQKP